MSWSPQQEQAIGAVKRWYADPRARQIFRLFGYAGVGKTTIAKTIAAEIKGLVLFACYTGKAALVLQSKGCVGASTLHSLIYTVEEGDGGKPVFKLNPLSGLANAKLLIVDEVSMVGEELARDLLSFGVRVLVLGDPAQLPPVKDTGFFINAQPDFMLTEIHRQAADNPIIRMSMDVREGRRLQLGDYGDSRVIARGRLGRKDALAADQMLVGTNRTRRGTNGKMRALLGRTSPFPEPGDRVVCLRNNKEKSLLNGGLWDVLEVDPPTTADGIVGLRIKSRDNPLIDYPVDVAVPMEFFLGTEETLAWGKRRDYDEFDFAYALTVHKSQGSQWDDVIVFDESRTFREDAAKHLYTAITRAAERVTVVV